VLQFRQAAGQFVAFLRDHGEFALQVDDAPDIPYP